MILIVEDDPYVSQLIHDALRTQDYSVEIASNLQEAARRLAEEIPEAVLLDRTLPDGDGLWLCVEARRNPRLKNVPFMVLSGLSDTEDITFGLTLGSDDYLAKPFGLAEMIARVNRLARPRQAAPNDPLPLFSPV